MVLAAWDGLTAVKVISTHATTSVKVCHCAACECSSSKVSLSCLLLLFFAAGVVSRGSEIRGGARRISVSVDVFVVVVFVVAA